MNFRISHYLRAINILANADKEYLAALKEVRTLENQCDKIIASLPSDQQAALWDYLMLCESMSMRKLEIACTYFLNR